MSTLTPAAELAAKNSRPYPNDSPEYRAARVALLPEEIELRRHIGGSPVARQLAFARERGWRNLKFFQCAGDDFPRGAPDPTPLWNILDLTPAGCGTDWHPKLEYGQ